MAVLAWHQLGDKRFEAGLDKGVLYLEDGTGIPWNGLVSVAERTAVSIEPLYFDGRKFNDFMVYSDYAATLSAFTYPDEFEPYGGLYEVGNGVSLYDQRIKRFGLSYRTKIGNDIVGLTAGYKIHVVYNLLAMPSPATYGSLSDSVSPVTFNWEISAVPVDLAGYEPTAHIVIDSTKTPAGLILAVEGKLYGNSSFDSELPDMSYLLQLAGQNW